MKVESAKVSLDFLLPEVYVATSEKYFKKILKSVDWHEKIQWKNEDAHAVVHFFKKDGKKFHVVCIETDYSKDQILALLVHEATHIKQDVIEGMNEKNPSREFEAYLMQSITLELLNLLNKQVKLF